MRLTPLAQDRFAGAPHPATSRSHLPVHWHTHLIRIVPRALTVRACCPPPPALSHHWPLAMPPRPPHGALAHPTAVDHHRQDVPLRYLHVIAAAPAEPSSRTPLICSPLCKHPPPRTRHYTYTRRSTSAVEFERVQFAISAGEGGFNSGVTACNGSNPRELLDATSGFRESPQPGCQAVPTEAWARVLAAT